MIVKVSKASTWRFRTIEPTNRREVLFKETVDAKCPRIGGRHPQTQETTKSIKRNPHGYKFSSAYIDTEMFDTSLR